MLTPGLNNYAMGWFVGERWGRRMLSHTGFLPGYASIIEWYPESKTTVILVSNLVGPRLPLIARDLGAAAFDKPYDVRVARVGVPLDTASATKLTGAYTLSDGRVAMVALRDDLLMVSVPAAFNAGAFPISRDEFYAPFFENTVRFERDAAGMGDKIFIRFFGETWTGARQAFPR
jgi:hypothetical protein